MRGEVVSQGKSYVARVTNCSDWRRQINTNWGPEPRHKATLTWYFQTRGGELFEYKPTRARAEFSLERIVALEPGERLELARVERREVVEALGEKGRLLEAGPHGFVYSNFLRRGWSGRGQGVGRDGAGGQRANVFEQLPRFIYTGRMSCLPTRETTTPANTSKFERIDLLE